MLLTYGELRRVGTVWIANELPNTTGDVAEARRGAQCLVVFER